MDQDQDGDMVRPEKVAAVTVADLQAYYASSSAAAAAAAAGGSPNGGGGSVPAGVATITLPAAGSWTQADLDQATAIGGQFGW